MDRQTYKWTLLPVKVAILTEKYHEFKYQVLSVLYASRKLSYYK